MSELIAIPNIEVLIDRVRTAHREAQEQADKAKEYASRAIDRALEAGDLLLLLKPTVKHGEWEAFLAEKLPEISIRQAQKYMRIARDLPLEKRTGALLTVNGALRMLESPDDDLAVIDVAQEPTPPWWETETPENNSAWCSDGDLLHTASVWMDTEGKTIAEISAILGVDPSLVAGVVDPQIPDDLYLGAGEEAKAEDENEMKLLWNSVKEQAKRKLAYIASRDYDAAVRLAEQCCNPSMAMRLSGIAEMHRSRYRRIVKTDDPLIDLVSLRLFSAALKRESLFPAAWMELGMAAILTDRKKPKLLDIFSKAFEVIIHCQKEWIEKPHTAPYGGLKPLKTKPLHLAVIHGAR